MRLLFSLFSLSTLLVNAASSDDRRAISEMPITTNVLESAYFPLIQPYPGRTTNDNFRATVSTLFHGRFGETVTNLFVTNLTVINLTVVSNFFNTTTNITAYEITVTNNISHDRIFISTNITINGFDINTWTNDNSIFHPTIERGVGPGTYSFLVATNVVRVGDNRLSGTEIWVNKSIALNIGDNQIPVAGNSQWNLIAATSNPDDTTISLMNGITDAQKLVIYNLTNAVPANGAFKLTNGTPIPDSLSGGITRLMGGRDWVATNGSWIMLEFHSPDWIEMDDRNVFTGVGAADLWQKVIVGGVTNLAPVDSTYQEWLEQDGLFGSKSTDGSIARFGAADGNLAVVKGVSAVSLIGSGASDVRWTGNTFSPISSNARDLGFELFGTGIYPWRNLWLSGTNFITGYDDGLTGTNYSRCALYHTGTNGDVVLDSQASGIAGSPRPFEMRANGVTLGTIEPAAMISSYTNVVVNNLASGNNDLWTVPSGLRAAPVAFICSTTNTGGSTTVYSELKTGGNYFRLGTGSTISTNTQGTPSFNSFVFEAGDVIALNASQIGVNAIVSLVLIPDTTTLKTYRNTAMAAADNTIYTVPVGKVSRPTLASGIYTGTALTLSQFQDSGGPLFYKIKLSGNTICENQSLGSAAAGVSNVGMLSAGDAVVVNSNSADATQIAWITVVELPLQ